MVQLERFGGLQLRPEERALQVQHLHVTGEAALVAGLRDLQGSAGRSDLTDARLTLQPVGLHTDQCVFDLAKRVQDDLLVLVQ